MNSYCLYQYRLLGSSGVRALQRGGFASDAPRWTYVGAGEGTRTLDIQLGKLTRGADNGVVWRTTCTFEVVCDHQVWTGWSFLYLGGLEYTRTYDEWAE